MTPLPASRWLATFWRAAIARAEAPVRVLCAAVRPWPAFGSCALVVAAQCLDWGRRSPVRP
eukprot:10056161-Alexandrium_andersonii.AAC.1